MLRAQAVKQEETVAVTLKKQNRKPVTQGCETTAKPVLINSPRVTISRKPNRCLHRSF